MAFIEASIFKVIIMVLLDFLVAANLLKCVKRKSQKIQTKIIVAGCS